ncbi:BON domain-containing protein [Burkholderia oklahomensis]|uniref:BON domain protein n=1 Tax=Burkholderia oklahomensis TaxID=342113 RepID=A0AAI8BDQ2_9BURK|nr:BON domain-containing protein [Burkholderia oklahomensis]AIO70119.1 BON domain protein [Burkholderia oklahomensis]AJX35092.1 BON domain protein [Burkholderia oklahomensis C6786]AOI40492.1 OsmY domain-containing protein [Burkholderia oklahomensis EO147]AOI50126.1 OsmY domain-containing protein [Burkholderia oklahomensis C6786]KUY48673.1 OsmY domain-containing protein [Burkholderia oklahomensis EO147]
MKTDRQIKQEVEEELTGNPMIDVAHFNVDVAGHIVTLTGHPSSYAEKLAAEKAANRVAGVRAVVVDVQVRLPQDDVRSDEEIADAARSILHWTVGLHDAAVQVQVESGWVTVSGKVDWAYQSHVAVRAIAQMRGVTGVTNEIAILGDVSADEIAGGIRRAMQRHAEREAKHIDVTVKDGTVTLTGKVDSYAERAVARGAAWSMRGVRAVVDDLIVE